MPINVICPGCHARFAVNEKFAGKEGPCPKCKGKITIPKLTEQVKVHASESEAGAKDSKGRSVLKPLERKETKLSPLAIVGIVVGIVGVFVATLMLRDSMSWPLIAGGLAVISPVLAFTGYSFLRNPENEPFRGMEVLLRSLLCGLLYAGLWGLYAWVPVEYKTDFWPGAVAAALVVVGGLLAFACLDFEFGMGILHFGFYLLITLLLAVTGGLQLWGFKVKQSPLYPTDENPAARAPTNPGPAPPILVPTPMPEQPVPAATPEEPSAFGRPEQPAPDVTPPAN